MDIKDYWNIMELIIADLNFDLQKMHEYLLIYGYYCYHDDDLRNIVSKESIVWEDEINGYASAECSSSTKYFVDTQVKKFKELYPNLKLITSGIYYGIEEGVGVWHTDSREKMTIQALCYQEDFQIDEGGSLQIKCYDGIERHYYPKNGDVMIINHAIDITHKIDIILVNKKRIVLNMVFQ